MHTDLNIISPACTELAQNILKRNSVHFVHELRTANCDAIRLISTDEIRGCIMGGEMTVHELYQS